MKAIIGGNLKAARESAGFSQEAFAEKLGISRATLSGIENGHVAIDSTKLITAARILGRPVSDFFLEEEEAMALLYRAAVDVAAPIDAISDFERFCKAYRELEEIVGVADRLVPPPDYSYYPGTRLAADEFASQVAYSERERLGLGQRDPIDNIFKLLEDQGVKILLYKIEGQDVYGLSAYSRRYGLCIVVNSLNTLERQIFSLAHEYGHLLMHRSFYQTATPAAGLDKESDVERMASVFAANFLVPDAGLREAFWRDVGQKRASLEDIVFLKKHFKVSAQMMLRRLKTLDLIHGTEADHLQSEMDRHVRSDQEFVPLSGDLLSERQAVSRFQHLARKVALEQMVSLGKLAELLGLNVVDTRKKVQEWRKEMACAPA